MTLALPRRFAVARASRPCPVRPHTGETPVRREANRRTGTVVIGARILAAVLCLAATHRAAAQGEAPVAVTHFAHPGLFTGSDELHVLQRRVAAADPADAVYQGWRSVLASKFSNLNFVPQPMPIVQRLKRKTDDPPVLERDSAMVAYTLALRWAIGGDATARDKSIAIMDAWADVFQDHAGDENTYLDSSWVTPVWCGAGELIRYAEVRGRRADWPAARVERFAGMIRKLNAQSSRIITRPFNPNSNWGSSSMLADMAAGVFLDDPAVYTRGRDALLQRMPHILLKPGYASEVFRDSWHGTVAFTAIQQAAELARHQNDLSIYHAKYDGQDEPRLVVSMKWYGTALRGIPIDLPPMGGRQWKPKPWVYDGAHSSKNTGGFEMSLNFYTYLEPTAGLDGFRAAVLQTYRPSGQDNSIYIESDSLTHGDLSRPGPPRP